MVVSRRISKSVISTGPQPPLLMASMSSCFSISTERSPDSILSMAISVQVV